MKQNLYVIVSTAPGGMDNLHGMLEEGWKPVRETAMGGAGSSSIAYALVLLEKETS